jgi:hypothetical protein
MLHEWGRGEIPELVHSWDLIVSSEADETLAEVTSNHTSFLIYKPVFQDQGCGVGTQNL